MKVLIQDEFCGTLLFGLFFHYCALNTNLHRYYRTNF